MQTSGPTSRCNSGRPTSAAWYLTWATALRDSMSMPWSAPAVVRLASVKPQYFIHSAALRSASSQDWMGTRSGFGTPREYALASDAISGLRAKLVVRGGLVVHAGAL
jgi:hypothetical protein